MTRLVLHIGTKKTGTTSVQRILGANVERLRQEGWSYPDFLRNVNHRGLVFPFEETITEDHIRRSMTTPESRAARADELAAEFAARVEPGQNWIISGERFSGRLQTPAEVAATVGFFRQFFDEIVVVGFLRRQEYLFPSAYSQTLKSGRTPTWSWSYCADRLFESDYDAMQRRWAAAVGEENLRLRPYLETYQREPAASSPNSTLLPGCRSDRTGTPRPGTGQMTASRRKGSRSCSPFIHVSRK